MVLVVVLHLVRVVLRRRVQEAARVQLGDRRDAAPPHARISRSPATSCRGTSCSYWAVTVGTNLVHYVPLVGGKLQDLLIGGDQIGQSTLLRFYALHVAVLPVLARR